MPKVLTIWRQQLITNAFFLNSFLELQSYDINANFNLKNNMYIFNDKSNMYSLLKNFLTNIKNKNHSACVLNHFSCVQLFATPCTVALQAALSTGFCKQEYWSGLPCPFPRDLPDPGIEPASAVSPALQMDSLPLSYQGNPKSTLKSTISIVLYKKENEKWPHLCQSFTLPSSHKCLWF